MQLSPRNAAARFPKWEAQLCDDERRADMEGFFRERIGEFTGGPRILARTAEAIRLCAAFKNRQQESLVQFLRDRSSRELRPVTVR